MLSRSLLSVINTGRPDRVYHTLILTNLASTSSNGSAYTVKQEAKLSRLE